MIGLADRDGESEVPQYINMGVAVWSLICGFTVAMLVRRFRRRVMYMTCTISLLCVYIAWTISMERAMHADENGYENTGAAISTVFWIYMASFTCFSFAFGVLQHLIGVKTQ